MTRGRSDILIFSHKSAAYIGRSLFVACQTLFDAPELGFLYQTRRLEQTVKRRERVVIVVSEVEDGFSTLRDTLSYSGIEVLFPYAKGITFARVCGFVVFAVVRRREGSGKLKRAVTAMLTVVDGKKSFVIRHHPDLCQTVIALSLHLAQVGYCIMFATFVYVRGSEMFGVART